MVVWMSQSEELEVEGEHVQVLLSEEEEVVVVAAEAEEAPSLKCWSSNHKTRDLCSAFQTAA